MLSGRHFPICHDQAPHDGRVFHDGKNDFASQYTHVRLHNPRHADFQSLPRFEDSNAHERAQVDNFFLLKHLAAMIRT